MPLSKKIEKADIALCNDGNQEELKIQINRIIPNLVM